LTASVCQHASRACNVETRSPGIHALNESPRALNELSLRPDNVRHLSFVAPKTSPAPSPGFHLPVFSRSSSTCCRCVHKSRPQSYTPFRQDYGARRPLAGTDRRLCRDTCAISASACLPSIARTTATSSAVQSAQLTSLAAPLARFIYAHSVYASSPVHLRPPPCPDLFRLQRCVHAHPVSCLRACRTTPADPAQSIFPSKPQQLGPKLVLRRGCIYCLLCPPAPRRLCPVRARI
jgi:hypothetical protein